MALLDATNRARILAHIMRRGGLGSITGLTKADLSAAVDATDSWIDTNATAFNSAVPLPARTALTASQKTALFCYVAMRRAGLLQTEAD